jgi:class 3 adenylate cyclase/DNA-binding winged helix-turn-helix (wHTH) protein
MRRSVKAGMRFSVLGPLEAFDGERVLAVGAGRQRALLALLLVHGGEIVSRDRLIDELWRGAPPRSASQSLDAYVSRLRRALRADDGEVVLITRAPGYLLQADVTDARQFEDLVDAGREALAAEEPERAATLLREGLALWRGTAYVEVADEAWARPEAERLEELRLSAIEDRIEAELSLGRHAALVPELELLATRYPTRERLVGQLMLALYRCGRQADALDAYQAARDSLVEHLGLEPGPELRRLQAAVLGHDAALRLASNAPRESVAVAKTPPPTVPAGERKQVTVLFADVVDSMGLADQVDPEELRRIMQRCFSILSAGVHRLEGTVDNFTGDGIMAIFGAPIAHEDHARRACYAALHLQQELIAYADELRARGLQFSVRIGLNSGEVVVGAIGEDLAMQYTAIGLTVGLAQRMEQLADPGTVYISESTASLAAGYFELSDLGEREVKGVRHPVRVHQLIGVGEARNALDVARARGLSGFVGRARELRALNDACRRGFAEKGQLVGIVGDAGVGKSRLCHEFAEQQRTDGVPVYRVAGQAHAKAVPLHPVLEFLRGFFAITERDSDATARQRIASRLLGLDKRFDDELPLVFDFLAVPDPDRPVERMDPEARQRRLLAFMKRLTHAQGKREPVVTVIEDLHWLDPASETFLANHVNAINGTRGLTIVNFRPEYRAEWMSRSYYRQIALEPLEPMAIDALLAELLGSDPSLAEVRELIRERTQGNPFFIEELVRSLVEARTLEGGPGAFTIVGPLDETAVPASVHAVLAARIDRLTTRDKTVLQAAAVIGREFPRSVLHQVLDVDATELDDALHHLVAAELVYEQDVYPEPVFTFKHPLTEEVAYRTQLATRRARVHADVARAMAVLDEYRHDEQAALISHHWEAAGDRLEAARWGARAASWAGYNDPVQAGLHWRRVRTLVDTLPPSPEITELSLTATVMILFLGWRLGATDESSGDAFEREAAQLFSTGREEARRSGHEHMHANLLASYGTLRGFAGGDVDELVRLTLEAVAIADGTGDAALRVAMRAATVYPLLCRGRLEDALRVAQEGVDLTGGDPTLGAGVAYASPYATLLFLCGLTRACMGHLEAGFADCERCLEVAREHDDLEVQGWALSTWAVLDAWEGGNPAGTLAHARRAVDVTDRTGGGFSRAHAHASLADAYLHLEMWEEALSAAERSLHIIHQRRIGLETEPWVHSRVARAQLGRGDPPAALAAARRAVALAERRHAVLFEALARHALVLALLGQPTPDVPAARTHIGRLLILIERTGFMCQEPHVRLCAADVARLEGDETTAANEVRRAHEQFLRTGARGWAARVTTTPD